MKKMAIFFTIIIIIVVGVSYMYLQHQKNQNEITNQNKIYEEYLNKEKTGTEIATIINKAMDSNHNNEVEKDENGKYKDNGKNSINIDIKMIDDDNTYNMEKIFYGGISTFTSYYRDIKFKCIKIDYHKENGRVKYMLFEQITQ